METVERSGQRLGRRLGLIMAGIIGLVGSIIFGPKIVFGLPLEFFDWIPWQATTTRMSVFYSMYLLFGLFLTVALWPVMNALVQAVSQAKRWVFG